MKFNPSRRLYERLGFRVTHEDDRKVYMFREPHSERLVGRAYGAVVIRLDDQPAGALLGLRRARHSSGQNPVTPCTSLSMSTIATRASRTILRTTSSCRPLVERREDLAMSRPEGIGTYITIPNRLVNEPSAAKASP